MVNYIYTNSNILKNKIDKIILKSKKIIQSNKCKFCDKNFDSVYSYKKIKISDSDIHLFEDHNMIDFSLYTGICKEKLELEYTLSLLDSNSIQIMDGLYENGGIKKYLDQQKNLYTSKKNKFSEHYGFIVFKDDLVEKITTMIENRVDKKTDPDIYQPLTQEDHFEVNYIYHTHPKTPWIGSRLKHHILYEFPSISDILHFIDCHNLGKLLASLIITPEGMYIIQKYNFNRENIKLDFDIFIDKLEDVYIECRDDAYEKHKSIDYSSLKLNNEIKLPEEYFYSSISKDFTFINKINNLLKTYDLFIDYYPRIKLSNTNYWLIPDIYLPNI